MKQLKLKIKAYELTFNSIDKGTVVCPVCGAAAECYRYEYDREVLKYKAEIYCPACDERAWFEIGMTFEVVPKKGGGHID